MRREPPAAVRRELRHEVGFGCPVQGCGSPYLIWHHFDPPWRQQHHHDPAGMVALCREHHDKADAGAYRKDQLRKFKEQGAAHAEEVKGRFDWLRHQLLTVIGGNFFYDKPIIFNYYNKPVIWFKRDEEGYMLLNVRMLSTTPEPRLNIEDNFWMKQGSPEDLESPPHGKLLRVKYSNGDSLRVQFFELESPSEAASRYSEPQVHMLLERGVKFPLTAVEVQNNIAGTGTSFGPGRVGPARMRGSVSVGGMFALAIGPTDNVPFDREMFLDPAKRWNYDPDRLG